MDEIQNFKKLCLKCIFTITLFSQLVSYFRVTGELLRVISSLIQRTLNNWRDLSFFRWKGEMWQWEEDFSTDETNEGSAAS